MAGKDGEAQGWRPRDGVCLEGPAQGRRYAFPSGLHVYMLTFLLVIRLKQVEHIRNERNVLRAVAGHPFITTLVTSFQDYDSLYMLVKINTDRRIASAHS
jgi:hypothetical protein